MPSVHPEAPHERAGVPIGIRLLRMAANTIVALVAAFCILLLVVRFVAFPRIEAHRDDIAALLSKRIGQPVAIGAIVTGWDGWNPRLSIRELTVADRDAAEPVLELPRVDMVIAWTSLPRFDLQLRELAIESPKLSVRRDARGLVHVAGIEIDPEAAIDDNGLSDWLLRQRRIVVHDALVTWQDERRGTPQLVLDHVDLRIQQGFGEHRFGLTGAPPADIASPIDLRGEFSAASLREWQRAKGRVYLRLDYADLAAWREWLPLPVALDAGKGAVRLWFEFADGAPRAITADLELVDVRARLAADLPAADLQHVAGRMSARQDGAHREISARGLTFVARDGSRFPETDFRLRYDDAHGNAPPHGDITFDRLALAPLGELAAALPLPQGWRDPLARFAPTGTLKEGKLAWDGPADAPLRYSASAQFAGIGTRAQDLMPGVRGLTGRIDATEAKGTVTLDSRDVAVALPHVLTAPLAFDSAAARVSWTRAGDALNVRIDDATFANADLAGTAAGTWRSEPKGPGSVDLHAQLTRARVEPIARYLPLQLAPAVRDWLARALRKGTSNDVRLTLKGNLDDFPFPQNRGGQFVVAIKGHDATLDYADGWPPITDIDADVRFEGSRMSIDAVRGRVLGAGVGRTHVEIPDMREHPAVLKVDGIAEGATTQFLEFVSRSPVGQWIDNAQDSAKASGNGKLALRFQMPLTGGRVDSLAGDYEFVDNEVRWTGAPAVMHVNGKLAFTERGMQARDVTGEALGGPVKVTFSSGDGRVRVNATGSANLAQLRQAFDVPLVDRMSGSADWQLAVDSRADAVSWVLESPLKGVAIDLPAPLGKAADEAMPLRIVRRELRAGREDMVTIDYGRASRVLLHRQLAQGSASVDRALVLVGKAIERTAEPERNGLWIRADLPNLNVDDWLAFQRKMEGASGSRGAAASSLALQSIDVRADMLQAMSRRFDDMKVSGQRAGDGWRLTLEGREIAGTATWQGATPAQPNGRVVARLTRLTPPAAGELPPWAGGAEPARDANAANPWPAIDVTSEAFFKHGSNVGKLEVIAQPAGADWQIQKLSLVNDAGRIDAHGVWHGGRDPKTQLDVKVDVKESGAFLKHFAMPDAIRGAPTTIEGQLAWTGAPSDFDYPSLSGSFSVRSGAGQFLKADPGVGRLLGVLSLQALPRRITLDFRDVFSEGFAFDNVVGTVAIRNGVMHTDKLRLSGPAAGVDIAGDVDLARETQQLRVRVQPSLSSSVSAGAAALFLANPLVGAAVGAGTLLAQRMLNNPIEQMFSYEYGVSGSWDDPVVQRLSARTPTTKAENVK
jgi:uncharacterized protein (TIGR02099 family)